jgi:hypothetical protein
MIDFFSVLPLFMQLFGARSVPRCIDCAGSRVSRRFGPTCVALSLAFLVGGSHRSHADLVAFDGFDYVDGPLEGSGGGFGAWAGAWGPRSGSPPTVEGGRATITVRNDAVAGSIRRGLSSPLGGAGTTTWLRFHGEYSTTAATLNATGGLSLFDDNLNETLRIGKFVDSAKWSLGWGAETVESAVSLLDRADLWVRIRHFSGSDQIHFWANPTDTSSEAALDANNPSWSIDTVSVRIDGVRLFANPGSQSALFSPVQTWAFDNVRVGTSFGAMSAVPEPSSTVLLAVGMAGLAFRLRRDVRGWRFWIGER